MRINFKKQVVGIFVFLILLLLYLSSLYNYLLFHTLAEIFSISIAFTVFLIAWNSEKYLNNNYLILIGTAYLFIGALDLFHTLSYKGMQIFKGYDYYANQLWIAARYFESVVLLISFAFLRLKRKINKYIAFSVFFMVSMVLILSIFVWRTFPVCFVDGVGLTSFKVTSEYIISLLLLFSIIVLLKVKKSFEPKISKYLFFSMVFTIVSELAFTAYIDNYDLSNLIGHYFKIFSFYLIYKAIIVTGIQEPYNIIFREMKQAEEKLNKQNEILKNQAIVDGLTGLYNHRHLYERLEMEAHRSRRYADKFTILLIDIDLFKIVNDTHGHICGDQILKELSMLLMDNIRETDVAGRYGGEEFLLILVETSLLQGYAVAEKIRQAVENHIFEQGVRITISIGVSEYSNEPISDFVKNADIKLYEAKNGGRNMTIG